MAHATYNDALFQEEARVVAIHPIGMIGDTENSPEWLVELFFDTDDPSDPLFQALPELRPDADDASEWARALVMHSRGGFIVRFEVCVRTYSPRSVTSYQVGWGWVQLGTIYVEEIEQIGPAVLKLARDQHEAEQAKAGAP